MRKFKLYYDIRPYIKNNRIVRLKSECTKRIKEDRISIKTKVNVSETKCLLNSK